MIVAPPTTSSNNLKSKRMYNHHVKCEENKNTYGKGSSNSSKNKTAIPVMTTTKNRVINFH